MKIAFTGGGSAGHVIPNLVIIDECKKQGFDVFYIGSKNGIERTLIKKENIPYFSIPTGKLRRYFSFKNFTDIIKIFFGIVKAFFLCRKIKPNIIFSKGGFVSFPLVFAAWLNKIPIIIHESDLTIGLANKLSFPFATKICVSFLETKKHIKNKEKVVFTGNPIRKELYLGNRERGLAKSGFTRNKPVILVYAGSLGSIKINKLIRDLLPKLINDFQIIHVCGKGNTDPKLSKSGYTQFEYISDFSYFLLPFQIAFLLFQHLLFLHKRCRYCLCVQWRVLQKDLHHKRQRYQLPSELFLILLRFLIIQLLIRYFYNSVSLFSPFIGTVLKYRR